MAEPTAGDARILFGECRALLSRGHRLVFRRLAASLRRLVDQLDPPEAPAPKNLVYITRSELRQVQARAL